MPEAKTETKPEAKTETKPKTSGIPESVQALGSQLARVLSQLNWPLTLLLLVFFFWSPLHKLVGALPDALANSDTLTVGSLSLRVGKKLSDQANQDVRGALSGMFANDITLVVQNELGGSLTYSGGILSDTLDSWERLGKLEVVVRLSDEELTKTATEHNQPKAVYGVKATAKYFKVRKFLLQVLNDVVAGGVRDSQPAPSGK